MAMPTLFESVRVHLIHAEARQTIQIAAQIEWFDLIDETLAAFFVLPLYSVLQAERDELPSKICSALVVFAGLYAAVTLSVMLYTSGLVQAMDVAMEIREASVRYLRWESVAFILGFVRQFWLVVLVIHGKTRWIFLLAGLEAGGKVLGDLWFIPGVGELGIAISNLLTQGAGALILGGLLYRHGLVSCERLSWRWLGAAFRKGSLSGTQVLLDNFIYAVLVVRIMNDLAVQEHYWVANSFIWGWLLLPVLALMELVKREGSAMLDASVARHYLIWLLGVAGLWLISMPCWGWVYAAVMGSPEPEAPLRITLLLIPFYLVFIFGFAADNVLYGLGRTGLCLLNSAVINFGYYPLVYGALWLTEAAITVERTVFIFGAGILLHSLLSFYLVYRVQKTVTSLSAKGQLHAIYQNSTVD